MGGRTLSNYRKKLGIQDSLWLLMDRPNNLMVVDSVIWTAEPLDRDRTREVLTERLWNRYPVFRSLAVKDSDGDWWWEEDPTAKLEDVITYVELDDPDDPRSLQELVAAHRTEPLGLDRPLWRVLWVDRYLGGSALIVRSHHSVADGMRMVQLSMSLFGASPEGGAILAPAVDHYGAHTAMPAPSTGERTLSVMGALGDQATGTVGAAVTAVREAVSLAWRVPGAIVGTAGEARGAVTNPFGALHGWINAAWVVGNETVAEAGEIARSALMGSGPLVEVFSGVPGDIDTIRKLLLGTRNNAAIWTGSASDDKAVSWSEPLSLAEVKQIARSERVTVNDVLATCVAGALHRYLVDRDQHCASVTFMVPVNLTPIDLTLPEELGNSFALVQLELPTDEPDLVAVLHVVRRRMDRIKHGHEAAVAFRVQETVAGLSRSVYEASVDLLANRTVGVLTNVPGPPMPVYLAGCRVEGMTGWAPLSGDQPMSFTIYSYDGRVTVGVACDRQLIPDHEALVVGFVDAFADLRARVSGAQ
ncbi:MAG: WS/DGAT domain-containing protein [Aquihabitans sp.]